MVYYTCITATASAKLFMSTPHRLMFELDSKQPWNAIKGVPVGEQDFDVRADAGESLNYAAITMKQYYDRVHHLLILCLSWWSC
jgi:hypothetical protein